jgi:hypothetical protein
MPQLHEIWPGRNRFCCGKCLTGPVSDCGPNLCWYGCAGVVAILFCIFILGRVWYEVTPALPVILFLCILITTILYNLTACTDPGIIPRRPIL